MTRPLARALRAFLWIAAVLIVLWASLIKGPMIFARIRMQRLMADFHSIYPMQSTWPDAQHIITRWQHWGYPQGPCTSTDCDYTIEVSDPISRWIIKWPENQRGEVYFRVLRSLAALGWREPWMHLRIVVQDGRIVRTRTAFSVQVYDSGPPEHWDYTLMLDSQVRPRLKRPMDPEDSREPWILGDDEQLVDHPDYKIGRPGGCEGCESVQFSYTPTLNHSVVVRLTEYDLSCLTRLRACTDIGDLLPAGRDWHFYDGDAMAPKPSGGLAPISCSTEPRALGRDAKVILEVDPISVRQDIDASSPGHPITYEVTRAKLIRTLKGQLHGASGTTIAIETFPGLTDDTPPEAPEHLIPGRRAFVLLDESHGYSPDGRFQAPRCGVLDDTLDNLAALQLGMSQDFAYRRPPMFGD